MEWYVLQREKKENIRKEKGKKTILVLLRTLVHEAKPEGDNTANAPAAIS
jgi:hypothetical protein